MTAYEMLRCFVFFKQKTAYEMLRSLVGFKQKTAYEMLRSLVGSEMCIRDRHKAFRWRSRWARTTSSPRRCWTCLLYTSDAADDLTRVDVGGRRIIKKKK